MIFRNLPLALLAAIFLAPAAFALPVHITVEPWPSTDGNFGFSALHQAAAGEVQHDDAAYFVSGGLDYTVDVGHVLSGDLTDDVLRIDAGSIALSGGATLHLSTSFLDFGVAEGELLGTLGYELLDGGVSERGSFYFFAHTFSNGDVCSANGFCDEGVYRLWGNNWNNQVAMMDDEYHPEENVLINGQRATMHRGIDLGGNVNPIPEPGAALLFGAGLLAIGTTRDSRRA